MLVKKFIVVSHWKKNFDKYTRSIIKNIQKLFTDRHLRTDDDQQISHQSLTSIPLFLTILILRYTVPSIHIPWHTKKYYATVNMSKLSLENVRKGEILKANYMSPNSS